MRNANVESPELGRYERKIKPGALIFLGISLVVGAIAMVVGTSPHRKEQALERADFGQLQRLASEQPDDARIQYHLGKRQEELARFDDAAHSYSQAVKADSEVDDYWLDWARAAGYGSGGTSPVDILEEYVSKHPGVERPHAALARAYKQVGNNVQARQEAEAALKETPALSDAWSVLGETDLVQGNLPQADLDLRKAIAGDIASWRAHYDMGIYLLRMKRLVNAVDSFRHAAKLSPHQARIQLGLATALLEEPKSPSDLAEAEASLAQVETMQPSNPMAHLLMGKALALQGSWKAAQSELLVSTKIDPQSVDSHYWLERTDRELGDTEGAAAEQQIHHDLLTSSLDLQMLTTRIALGDHSANLRLRLARLYAAQSDWQKAVEQYRALILENPKIAGANQELAAAEAKLNSGTP